MREYWTNAIRRRRAERTPQLRIAHDDGLPQSMTAHLNQDVVVTLSDFLKDRRIETVLNFLGTALLALARRETCCLSN